MEAKKNSSVKDIIGKLGPLLALIILCVGLQIATAASSLPWRTSRTYSVRFRSLR